MVKKNKPKGYEGLKYISEAEILENGLFIDEEGKGLVMKGLSGESRLPFNKNYYKRIKDNETKEKSTSLLQLEFMNLLFEKRKDEATELITDEIKRIFKIYTTKDDIKSEIWIYDGGIYVPNGRTSIKEFCRKVMGKSFNIYLCNQVIAKIEADTYIEHDNFFKNDHSNELAVNNGILNVKTKELSPFTPDKIFFNKLPIEYNPKKTCPKIQEFLKEVFARDDDINLFYEIGGFGLIKEYLFEKAFMFLGDGRNGKGKCLELMKKVVGAENCSAIPLSSLNSDSTSTSELFGKLFNLGGDISNKDLQDTGLFKSLTGRDLVSVKRKYLRDLHFENYAKMIFACNELPMVYDQSKGFWDRWILLEFPFYFADKKEYENASEDERQNWKIRDENIIQKITDKNELSGLFNKFLRGLDRILKNNGFSSTAGSDEVKSIWMRKSNSFIAFCMDNIEEDVERRISKKELRKKYSDYCKKHKISNKSDIVIKKTLQEMYGAIEERANIFGSNYEWFWIGIKLKNKGV